MTSNKEPGSSSLPTQHVPTIRSTPPIVTFDPSLSETADSPVFKSEPCTQQHTSIHQPILSHVSSADAERPPSAQEPQPDVAEEGETEDEGEGEDSGPADKIINFDWDGLHQRYHEAVNNCQGKEAELLQEWDSLMSYFRIWADAGHEHETERTFKRIRTRMEYVKHSEDKLEMTRNHFVNVVKAFESALSLLKASGFGG